MGLAGLGGRVVRTLILPHMMEYCRLLSVAMDDKANPERSAEAHHVHHAMCHAAGMCVRDGALGEGGDEPAAVTMKDMVELFGESLIAYSGSADALPMV